MNEEPDNSECKCSDETLTSEFMILPDGRILAHGLSPVMAEVLKELNPDDEVIRRRAGSQHHATSGGSRGNEVQIKNKLETPHVVSYNSRHHP